MTRTVPSRTQEPANGLRRFAPATLAAGFLLLCTLPAAAQSPRGEKGADDSKIRVKVEDPRRVVTLHRVGAGEGPRVFHIRGGYLGVELTDLTPELRGHFGAPSDRGVMVARVAEDSPAERAGLAVGDIITDVDGERIEGAWDLSTAIRRHEGGEQADLVVWRDGTSLDLRVEVAERERQQVHLEKLLERAPGAEGVPGEARVFRWKSDGDAPPLLFDSEGLLALGETMEKIDWPRLEGRLMNDRNRELEERLKKLEKQLEALEKALRESEDRRR